MRAQLSIHSTSTAAVDALLIAIFASWFSLILSFIRFSSCSSSLVDWLQRHSSSFFLLFFQSSPCCSSSFFSFPLYSTMSSEQNERPVSCFVSLSVSLLGNFLSSSLSFFFTFSCFLSFFDSVSSPLCPLHGGDSWIYTYIFIYI